jgi:hypothetical protein
MAVLTANLFICSFSLLIIILFPVIAKQEEDLPQKKPFNLLLLYSSHDYNWKTYVSIFEKTLKQIKIIRRKSLTKKNM